MSTINTTGTMRNSNECAVGREGGAVRGGQPKIILLLYRFPGPIGYYGIIILLYERRPVLVFETIYHRIQL